MRQALIVGSSQGIGLQLTHKLLSQEDTQVHATYRPSSRREDLEALKEKHGSRLNLIQLDATIESDYQNLKQEIQSVTEELHLLANCVGVLNDGHAKAERRLEEVRQDQVLYSFSVNTVPTLLLARELKGFFRHSNRSVFAALSARVGSLGDNKMGGWYSYRMSKAALNSAIRGISFEYKQLGTGPIVVALHPGTTETQLSEPFMKLARKKYHVHSPEETAENLLQVISNLDSSNSGGFFDYKGEAIPF